VELSGEWNPRSVVLVTSLLLLLARLGHGLDDGLRLGNDIVEHSRHLVDEGGNQLLTNVISSPDSLDNWLSLYTASFGHHSVVDLVENAGRCYNLTHNLCGGNNSVNKLCADHDLVPLDNADTSLHLGGEGLGSLGSGDFDRASYETSVYYRLDLCPDNFTLSKLGPSEWPRGFELNNFASLNNLALDCSGYWWCRHLLGPGDEPSLSHKAGDVLLPDLTVLETRLSVDLSLHASLRDGPGDDYGSLDGLCLGDKTSVNASYDAESCRCHKSSLRRRLEGHILHLCSLNESRCLSGSQDRDHNLALLHSLHGGRHGIAGSCNSLSHLSLSLRHRDWLFYHRSLDVVDNRSPRSSIASSLLHRRQVALELSVSGEEAARQRREGVEAVGGGHGPEQSVGRPLRDTTNKI